MRYLFESITTTAVLLASIGLVWSMAHTTVAHECDKMGAFYVGDRQGKRRAATGLKGRDEDGTTTND